VATQPKIASIPTLIPQAASGALFGMLFGTVARNLPVTANLSPAMRDATLGAAVATAILGLDHINQPIQDPTVRPADRPSEYLL
jgi:hypothetical protein